MTIQAAPLSDREHVDIDEMGEASFPASDPPAVWTWEVEPARAVAADPHQTTTR